MEPIFEINENSEKRFMQGKINLIIRLYFYLKEGVNQASGFRTIGYALIGIAGVLAVNGDSNWLLLILLGLASIPMFIYIGWLWVARGKKSEEYYQLKYTSSFGKYAIQMNERQMQLLEEIKDELKKLNDNNSR